MPIALSPLGSFKLKLVLWFALLALLPLAVMFYGYDTLAKRSEIRRTDVALEAGLRVAVAGFAGRLDAAAAKAEQLAASPALQHALRHRDRAGLARIVGKAPDTAVVAPSVRAGTVPAFAANRTVTVLARGRVLGRVIVSVPFDHRVLRALSASLAPDERLVAVRVRRSTLGLTPGVSGTVHVAGVPYRGLQTATLPEPPGTALAVLTPQSRITAAIHSTERKLAFALLASLLVFAAVTYLLGRSIVRTLRRLASAANALAAGRLGERVEVTGHDEFAELATSFNTMAAQLQARLTELEEERGRSREANVRFGEALAATHDPTQLVRIVVEYAVEATGAVGGVVMGLERELARVGNPDAGTQHIAFPLRVGSSDLGSLVISGDAFGAEEVEAAAALAAQAVIALDNARLHRIVERQALVDMLTGLANRRSLDESLRAELARATRYGGDVCLVLADLDNFKQVNDRYGHPAGDEVLKAFAETLREAVREMDVAGRWGGEEFALILPVTDAAGGAHLAERVRLAIADRTIRSGEHDELQVTASFGVASFQGGELGELVAAADSALYEAKREGRNRVVVAAESVLG